MKTLDRYITEGFLRTFVLAFLVLAFVLTIGITFQVVRYVSDGVNWSLVLKFAFTGFHDIVQFAVPLALLVSAILVFARLAGDHEMSAMRACGVNALVVARGPLLVSLVVALALGWLSCAMTPREHEVRKRIKEKLALSAAFRTIVPGQVADGFPGIRLVVDGRERNVVWGLRAWDRTHADDVREIQAKRATLVPEGNDLIVLLEDATVGGLDKSGAVSVHAGRFRYVVERGTRKMSFVRGAKDMALDELLEALAASKRALKRAKAGSTVQAAVRRQLSDMREILAQRLVHAAAAFALVFIGIPIGMLLGRRPSTIVLLAAILVGLAYHLLILLFTQTGFSPAFRPDLLVWIPVVICFVLGAWLFRRAQ